MNEVANLENCKRLYKLSGWAGTGQIFADFPDFIPEEDFDIPAYSLGFLLRKLPPRVNLVQLQYLSRDSTGYKWVINMMDDELEISADTPEDAACLLLCELFEQGIITKEGNV
jgi:hypothetical protein